MSRALSALRKLPFLGPQSRRRLISTDRSSNHPNGSAAEKHAPPRCYVTHPAASSDTSDTLDGQHQTPHLQRFSSQEISPQSITPSRTEDYNFSKTRIHASLWQAEVQKQFRMASHGVGNSDSLSVGDCVQDTDATLSDDWESFVRPGENSNEETAIKEENMLLEEFERRKEYNRVQVAKFVKQHLYARRRPVDGWKYIVNSFGVTKGAKVSAFQLDENRTSELEKLASKRELKNRKRA